MGGLIHLFLSLFRVPRGQSARLACCCCYCCWARPAFLVFFLVFFLPANDRTTKRLKWHRMAAIGGKRVTLDYFDNGPKWTDDRPDDGSIVRETRRSDNGPHWSSERRHFLVFYSYWILLRNTSLRRWGVCVCVCVCLPLVAPHEPPTTEPG